jgi:starch-binding outer membrane protein SusE/F
MKNINKILIAFASVLIVSCNADDVESRPVITAATTPVLLTPNTLNLVLEKSKENDIASAVVWNDATYSGSTTVVNYVIEIAKSGTNFASPVTVTTTTNRFKSLSVGELNSAVLDANLKPFIEHEVDLRIKSYVGANVSTGISQFSNSFKLKLTPYPSWANWGIIGSATPTGWNSDTNLDFDLSTKLHSITIPLQIGEIKFRLDDAWTTNFGDDGNDLSFDPNGSNIPITVAGNYKIVADFVKKTYTITKI